MKRPFQLIDLTHSLSQNTPTWSGGCGFQHIIHTDYDSEAVYTFRTHKIRMHEGIGTHIDAPAHCFPSGKCIDELNLNDLCAPCCVIDVSSRAHERYSLTVQDIEDFEQYYGPLPPGCFVIIYTGWEQHWHTPKKYHNDHVFPSISEAAAYALVERHVLGLGIDTLSPDRPDDGFPVHKVFLGAGKYIIENVANALSLPAIGAYSLAFPIKIQGGTEAPLRLAGLVMNDNIFSN